MTGSKCSAALRAVAGLVAAAAFMAGALPALAAGPILAGGTGSGSRLLQALADEYARTARGAAIRVADPPLGSGGAIKAVREGKLHLAISARPLEGGERGGELVEIELARTPFVFASRNGVRSGGFSLGQLEAIYGGRLANWDDGSPIRLILRPSFDADTQLLRSMSPGMDKAVPQALERKGMVIASSDMEALEIIEHTPGSLGATTLGLIRLQNSEVQLIAVAGRMPGAKALADGSYPWFKPLYLVTGRQPPADLQAFLDFLRSPQAAELLLRTEHLPAFHDK